MSDQQRVADWHRHHWPDCPPLRILAKAMSELGELADALLLATGEDTTSGKGNVAEELGDCLVTLYALADRCGIDLLQAGSEKFDKVLVKYPTEQRRAYSITDEGRRKHLASLARLATGRG